MRARLMILAIFCASTCTAWQPVSAESAYSLGWRDVLASAFTYPFLTDAEIDIRFDDMRGRIVCQGGPVLFRYPGISGVRVKDRKVEAQWVGRDLLRADLPAGIHEITILTDGPAPPTGPLQPAEGAVTTPEAFQERAARLEPGEELVIADGVYTDWRLEVDAQGTAEAPISIRAATPGGVTFRRSSRITLRGRHVILKGFRFDHVGPTSAVVFAGARECRMTQCVFSFCGNPTNMFAHIVNVAMESHRNRIDHCAFIGSKSMSVGQSIRSLEGVGMHNRYDRNVFRDIFRYWVNGQEPIQLGQNQARFGDARSEALVEFNLFDHAWGDSEIVSSKSSGNVLRHNVAAHCIRSDFTLRGGNEARFEGNVMVNNAVGVRPMGKRHLIINNLFLDMRGAAIDFSAGTADGANVVATEGALVAHNTFINSGGPAVTAAKTSEARPFAPSGNRFINNIFLGTSPALLETDNLPDSAVRRNLFWAGGSNVKGTTGEEAVLADPRLEGEGLHVRPGPQSPAVGAALPLAEVARDRWNRARPGGAGPDIGADERDGAPPAEPLRLPSIPPRPLLAPELYTGTQIWAQDPQSPLSGLRGTGCIEAVGDAAQLTDAQVEAEVDLPADYVLTWEYQPEAFAAEASLAFSAGEGYGYVLSWGGLTRDGLPAGVVELRRADSPEVIADGADLVYYHQDFRDHTWGPGIRYTNDSPEDSRWYRFVVIKQGGRLIVLLHGQIAAQLVPILVWEDGMAMAGSISEGPRLRITQSATGRWRGLRVWHHEYTGNRPPPPPVLSATAHGGSRVALEWREAFALKSATRFDVHRCTEEGFELTPESLLVSQASGAGFDDFTVRPDARYWYAVRAFSPLGLPSEPSYIEVTSGTGPPVYEVIDAAEGQLSLPMVLDVEAEGGRTFIWAPGAAPHMQEAPAEGSADFTVVVDEPGEYTIWGLVQAPDAGTDSFHIAVNPHQGGSYRAWHTGIHHWCWSRAPIAIHLERGEHVIRIKHREPRTRLAALLVTQDAAFTPAGR